MRETGIFAAIYLLICMVVCADDSPLVVGYYSSWLKNQTEAIGFSKYSHVIVSFANPCTNGSFVFPDFDVPDAVSKIHKDNAKALVSIGGWSYSTNFSSIMKDTTARTALADNIVTYVDENKLDGIDIDWEFPGVDSGQAGNGVDQANDTPNYLKLLQDLRKKLDAKFADDKKLITMAVGSQPFNVNGKPSTDLSEFAKVVDYANLMLYDFYGSWSKTSGPNAPLNGDGLSFMSVIKAWTDAKWPASKLTAGMAFYGHSVTLSSIGKDISTNQFQSKSDVVPKGDEGDVKETTSANFTGMWQYNYLRTGVLLDAAGKTAEHWTRYWDNSSMTPYLVNDQDKRFISYDDQQSIQAKVQFAKSLALILTLLAHVLNAGASQLVVGYYDVTKQDEARDVDLSKYTHLNLAFGAPNKDGSISFGQGVSLGDVVGKLNATKLKVLVSIGGWSGSRWFSGIMKDAAASSTMISNIIDIIDTNKLAGVDILWEYPGRAAGSCYAFDADADTTNFLKFLQTLREQLDSKFGSSKKLITLAVRIEPFDVKGSPSTDVSAFAKLVDYAHLMPFEINGAGQDTTGPLAPLNFEKGKGQPYSFVSAIDVWVNAGWPASQLTAGVSFSGRSASTVSDMTKDPTNQYQKQFNEVPKGDPEDGYWKDVCTDNIEISGQWQYKYLRKLGLLTAPTTAAPSIVRQWDSTSQTPWLFNTTVNRFYTYDDPESIKAKVDYAASKGLAGTMVWLVHMDYQNELIDAV
ncbi:hypothetical protein H4R23_002146, partial [Coemansia sp. Cherry 401B]